MLYGVPGCGKSTVAKYIAQQIGLPLVIARLDALVSSLLGSTSKNIRKVFDFADSRPCILFLDEFDAIAKARDDQHELGELKRVITVYFKTLTPFQAAAYLSLPQTMRICSTKLFGDVSTLFSKLVSQGKKEIQEMLNFSLVISRQPYQLKMTGKCPNLYLHLLNMATCLRQIFQTIVNNAKVQAVIKAGSTLSQEELLIQLFDFKNHDNSRVESLVKYLNEKGISQSSISEKLGISIRQIKNILNKED